MLTGVGPFDNNAGYEGRGVAEHQRELVGGFTVFGKVAEGVKKAMTGIASTERAQAAVMQVHVHPGRDPRSRARGVSGIGIGKI